MLEAFFECWGPLGKCLADPLRRFRVLKGSARCSQFGDGCLFSVCISYAYDSFLRCLPKHHQIGASLHRPLRFLLDLN